MLRTCFVTCLIDIGRAEWSPPFGRSMRDYIADFKTQLATLDARQSMVLFIDDRYVAEVSGLDRVNLVVVDHTDIGATFPLWSSLEKVEGVMRSARYAELVSAHVAKPVTWSAPYVLLLNSKAEMVERATMEVVADLYAWTNVGQRLCDVEKAYYPSRVSFGVFTFPYEDDVEYHLRTMPEVVIGNFFLGDRHSVASHSKLSKKTFLELAHRGYVGDERFVAVQAMYADKNLYFLLNCPSWSVMERVSQRQATCRRVFAFLMLKNEVGIVERSLVSLKGFVDGVYIYDTGSTDDTIAVCTTLCAELGLNVAVKRGEFVDFSTSRNEGLDFCDENTDAQDYLLLMDAGDELVDGHMLRAAVQNLEPNALMINVDLENYRAITIDSVRLIRAKSGWRYKGRTHECIYNNKFKAAKLDHLPFKLYQNREKCAGSTPARFTADIRNLEIDLKEATTEDERYRAIFYLANTHLDMGNIDTAREYYTKRLEYDVSPQERFWSQYRIAHIDMSRRGDDDTALIGFFRCLSIQWRAEALVDLSMIYARRSQFVLADYFARAACECEAPSLGLFVEHYYYDYERWHHSTAYAYEVGDYNWSLQACRTAIANGRKQGYDVANDEANLARILETIAAQG